MLTLGSKIVFIEPKAPGSHVYSQVMMPRTGPVLLATLLKKQGYNTSVLCEDIEPINWSVIENASAVCISTITSTAPAAYKIIRRVKELTHAPIIIGGPHVTFLPEEALSKGADIVVRREGEKSLLAIIKHMKQGRPDGLTSINGISFVHQGKIVHTPDQPMLCPDQLDQLPSPELSLVKGWNHKKRMMVYPLSLSRGCPYNCSFCSVVRMFGRKYRAACMEKTMQDLRYAAEQAHSTLFIVDDNMAANVPRTKEYLARCISESLPLRYSAQLRVEAARDHELVTLLKKSGCVRGYFGFESISSQTLRQTDKRQSVADIEHCIKVMLDYGIDVHGMFVFFGHESPKDISNTVAFARKNGITTAQFLIVTPFPGTPVYETMQQTGALLPLGWEHYTTHEPVFTPAKMSSSELLRRTVLANIRFYGPQYFSRHLSNGPNQCGHFYTLMGLYAQYTLWLQLFKNLIKEL